MRQAYAHFEKVLAERTQGHLIHPNDVERWRAKLDQIEAAIALDEDVQEDVARAGRAATSAGCGGPGSGRRARGDARLQGVPHRLPTPGRGGPGRTRRSAGSGRCGSTRSPTTCPTTLQSSTCSSRRSRRRRPRTRHSRGSPRSSASLATWPPRGSRPWVGSRTCCRSSGPRMTSSRAGRSCGRAPRTACTTSAGSPPGATPTGTLALLEAVADLLPRATRTGSSE